VCLRESVKRSLRTPANDDRRPELHEGLREAQADA